MLESLHISNSDVLLLSMLLFFSLVQLVYWFRYAKLLHYMSAKKDLADDVPPVSVIVVVNGNHTGWIKGDMEELFNQDHSNYEVIVVNDCGGEELTSLLQQMCVRYPIMKYTEIIPDKKFSHTVKVAKLLGIKSASYDNLIFVEPWCRPSSNGWLTEMASSYVPVRDVVIGMSLPEKNSKWWNGLARNFSMVLLLRTSLAAISGRPYCASRSNFGFTKKIFYANKGYNFLTTGYGDNDLYIRKIASRENTSLSLSSKCIMLKSLSDKFRNWFEDLKFSTATFGYYRKSVKIGIFVYLLSLLLFWVLLILSVLSLAKSPMLIFLPVACFVLRQTLVYIIYAAISRKLAIKGIMGGFILYDFYMPVFELFLSISRKFGAPSRF